MGASVVLMSLFSYIGGGLEGNLVASADFLPGVDGKGEEAQRS